MEIATPERIAKGGMIRQNGRYIEEFPLLIDWLLDKQKISEEAHRAGMDLISLHEVALSPVGYAKIRIDELLGRGNSDSCPLTIYTRLMRQMTNDERCVIEKVVFNNQATFADFNTILEKAFDKLEELINN